MRGTTIGIVYDHSGGRISTHVPHAGHDVKTDII